MKIFRTAIVMAIAVTGIVAAAPAEATGSRQFRGRIEGNCQPAPCADGTDRVVAWLGTVKGDDTDYGWVEFFGESKETPRYLYFEERWGILDLGPDGIPTVAEWCGPTLIEGDEAGIGFFGGNNPAIAFGTVTGDPTFPGVTEGSSMFWAGTVTADPATGLPISFEAGIRIWPRRRTARPCEVMRRREPDLTGHCLTDSGNGSLRLFEAVDEMVASMMEDVGNSSLAKRHAPSGGH